MRRRKGETVRSFWPLCLCCAPSEDESSFERTFSALKAELAAQNIVEPCQIHMDWTPAGKAAATKVFPKARPRRSLQHLRRNLRRNDSKGKRPPVARKPKKPAQAGKSRGGSGSAGSLKPPKKKLAPHLQTRSIWAFLNHHTALICVPTHPMLHVLLEAVLKRIEMKWNEPTWVKYFQEVYAPMKPVSKEIYKVEEASP